MPGTTISGQIRFDESAPPFRDATVRVILEDVSRVDAPAREVARLEVPHSHAPGDPPLDFRLETPTSLDPRRRYEVRVHVDLGTTGQKKAGDQITVQSHPVGTQGYPETVSVNVRHIR